MSKPNLPFVRIVAFAIVLGVEGVTRSKGLIQLARELGFEVISPVVNLGTDSEAAKSFVSRSRSSFSQKKCLSMFQLYGFEKILADPVLTK